MKLSVAIDLFTRSDAITSKATRRAYHSDLHMLLTSIRAAGEPDSVFSVTPAAIKRFLVTLRDLGRDPATRARKRTAIASFVTWGRNEGTWTWKEDPLRGVPQIKVPKRLPRPLRKGDRDKIMQLPLPLDQRVVRALLYYTGVRVTPLGQIRKEDVDLTPFTTAEGIPVAGKIRIKGKGGKTTEVYVALPLARILKEWFKANPNMKDYDLLLSQPAAYGHPAGRPYNMRFIERMVREWAKAAGVSGRVTPHRFRHTCGTDLLEQTRDLALVQEWLGHESITTTRGYAQVADVARASAALTFKDFEAAPPESEPAEELSEKCLRTTEHSPTPPSPTS
jgi:site-specific recombinase XerC